jgi:prepilin-type N-terminal cleavage/methylation domain-containing protein
MQKAITYPMGSRRARRRGFTLTEIPIVLGIVGLILGAIWVAAAAVYNNLRVGHANTEILQIAQGVRTLYATSNTTGVVAITNLTLPLMTAHVIPSDIATSPASASGTNPWAGGTTQVWTPATADSFTIQMTAVPQAACISLLSGVAGISRDASLFGVGSTTAAAPVVGAVAGTPIATAAGQIAVVTPTIATTACSNLTTNIVQFAFGLK